MKTDKLVITKHGVKKESFNQEEVKEMQKRGQEIHATNDLVDEEKAFMAEALIELSSKVESFETKMAKFENQNNKEA
ncbi:MAG: hypothetical protein N4A40_00495 [Tissierellales bacterium]|jgi:hypothetical protein|nr:hypothetical protein [Tissierellales bacterium]